MSVSWRFYSTMATSNLKKLYLVVAYDKNRGIGYKNKLPWPRLPTDFKWMYRITTQTKDSSKQNAVIMGRLTWESIPAKHRPLNHRYNIVLSSKRSEDISGPQAHVVCPTLTGALKVIQTPPLSDQIEAAHILGGSAIFEEAMQSPQCDKIYATELMAEFPCDVFFPLVDTTQYKIVDDDTVPQNIIEESGIKYKFLVYKRIQDIV